MAIQSVAADSHLSSTSSTGMGQATLPFSISTWVYAVWSAGVGSFIGVYGPTGTPTTAIQIGSRGDTFCHCWTFGGVDMVVGTTAMVDNTWSNITYTYDGTTHSLYVNGARVNTSVNVQQTGMLAQVYVNGYPTGVAAEASTHQVSMFSYYTRALSAAEAQAIYYANGNRHGIFNGLAAHYEFNEAAQGISATSVVDMTGNGNTLVAGGAAAAASPITYTYTAVPANDNLRRVH